MATSTRSRPSFLLLLVLLLFGILNVLPWWVTGVHTSVRPSHTTIRVVPAPPLPLIPISHSRERLLVKSGGESPLGSSSPVPAETKLVVEFPNSHKTVVIPSPQSRGPTQPSETPSVVQVDGDTGEVLGALGRSKVVTGTQLLEGYDPHRDLRTCALLPSNVTVKLTSSEMIGIKQIYIGADSDTNEYYYSAGDQDGPGAPRREKIVKSAYAMMVSNHKYIDGSFVMAESLKMHSIRVQKKEVDVIIIVSDKIKPSVIQQLRTVFDRVIVLYSTAIYAPKSYYAPTFDKMYLWWLTWYEKVIFMDADTIATGNPDMLFEKAPPKDRRSNFLTAVGGTDYFQTALMVLYPDRSLFTDIFLEFRFGTFGYNQWRARDGILLRTCFMPRHQNIPHPAQLHHYYGDVKPWFNKDMKHRRSRDKLGFDSYYKLFWDTFEKAHVKYFVPFFQNGGVVPRLNGSSPTGNQERLVYGVTEKDKTPVKEIVSRFTLDKKWSPDPTRYMWLQRYSKGSEYLRPTKAEYQRLRNWTLPGLHIEMTAAGRDVVSKVPHQDSSDQDGVNVNTSCTGICSAAGQVCDPRAFFFTSINSCAALNRTMEGRCTSCDVSFQVASDHTPFVRKNGKRKLECVSSFLHESPVCENSIAAHVKEYRICPCVESSTLAVEPKRLG